jgi:ribosome maturation factor RimP
MKSIEENIKNIVISQGVKLYDIENRKQNGNHYYTVYITSKDGISLDLCSKISKLISPLLDVDNPYGGKYFFEVSSPGLERKLKTKEHFLFTIGELVYVKTNSGSIAKGELLSANEDKIVVDDKTIFYSEIKIAKTYLQW